MARPLAGVAAGLRLPPARHYALSMVNNSDLEIFLILRPAISTLPVAIMSTRQCRITFTGAPVGRNINMALDIRPVSAWKYPHHFLATFDFAEVHGFLS
jgi:hypothetical protein